MLESAGKQPDNQAESAGKLSLLDHPRGLWIIGGTELWDRISFHGMQALLTLYMVDYLLLPGHIEQIAGFARYRAAVQAITGPLSVEALAAQTSGIYGRSPDRSPRRGDCRRPASHLRTFLHGLRRDVPAGAPAAVLALAKPLRLLLGGSPVAAIR